MTRHGRVIGNRTVAGRVVKESYGAAKQQHTFTVSLNCTDDGFYSTRKCALFYAFGLLFEQELLGDDTCSCKKQRAIALFAGEVCLCSLGWCFGVGTFTF